jgi:type I restriction enzyme, S subunit
MTDGPYKLPSGWRWVRLGEVCQINPRRPRINRAEEAATSFIPMNAVDEREGAITELQARPFGQVKKGYTFFEEGDVLFAKITPCMENGKATIAPGLIDGVGFGSTKFHVLRPGQELIAKWALLFVRQECFRQEATKAFRGAVGQQRVPQEFLGAYPVPLPPISEQCRIVARVEALMERMREAKQLRASSYEDFNTLIAAALAEVFSSKESQSGWPSIGELCEIRGGLQKSPSRTPKNNPRPYLRVANVQQGYLALQDIAYFEVSNSELERYRLLPDDVLIIEGNGSPELIGRTAIFRGEIENCVHQNHIIRLRPNKSQILSEFLSAYLTSPSGRRIIRELSHTSSGLLNLSVGKIRSIPIPSFSLSEQHRIVSHLHLVQTQAAALRLAQEDTDAELRRLEQAILDRAFRGEL